MTSQYSDDKVPLVRPTGWRKALLVTEIKGLLLALAALVAVAVLVTVLAGRSDGPRLPQGVHEIDVTAAIGPDVDHAQVRTWRITEPAQVKRVIGWFSTLKQVEPSTPSTGTCYGDVETFTFRSSNGAELATAGVPPGRADGCSLINIQNGEGDGRFFVEKATGMALIDRAKHILGPRFRPLVVLQR